MFLFSKAYTMATLFGIALGLILFCWFTYILQQQTHLRLWLAIAFPLNLCYSLDLLLHGLAFRTKFKRLPNSLSLWLEVVL